MSGGRKPAGESKPKCQKTGGRKSAARVQHTQSTDGGSVNVCQENC